MTKAWRYLVVLVGKTLVSAALVVGTGYAALAQTATLQLDVLSVGATPPGYPPTPDGASIFSGSVDFFGTYSAGVTTFNLYTSTNSVPVGATNYGVIKTPSASNILACGNLQPTGYCLFNPGATNNTQTGVLSPNLALVAGTYQYVANGGFVLTGLSFGFTTGTGVNLYVENNGPTYDLHAAGVDLSNGNESLFNSNPGGNAIINATAALPEINGGALAKGCLLLASLFLLVGARGSLRFRDKQVVVGD